MLEIQDEFDPPFEAVEPAECRGPVLFNSPHSGRIYPRAFLLTSRLDLATLRRSEDSFVDDLIAGIAARGHPIMKAHFPRCYVDVVFRKQDFGHGNPNPASAGPLPLHKPDGR